MTLEDFVHGIDDIPGLKQVRRTVGKFLSDTSVRDRDEAKVEQVIAERKLHTSNLAHEIEQERLKREYGDEESSATIKSDSELENIISANFQDIVSAVLSVHSKQAFAPFFSKEELERRLDFITNTLIQHSREIADHSNRIVFRSKINDFRMNSVAKLPRIYNKD